MDSKYRRAVGASPLSSAAVPARSAVFLSMVVSWRRRIVGAR
jgi:hypothetical protein